MDLETLSPILSASPIGEFSESNSKDLPSDSFGAWQLQVTNGYGGHSADFKQAIDDLIGIKGMARPSRQDFNRFLDFLIQLSPKWDLWNLSRDFSRKSHLRLTDLGSVADLAILLPRLSKMRSALKILEIGGGYGRLAEALIRNIESEISLDIQMIDVVPSSLALAEAYLKSSAITTLRGVQTFPKLESCVRLARAEKLALIESGSVDLVINVESFQEMTPGWVRWYLNEVNRITKKGSYFYQSNSFGYKNLFKLELGNEWKLEGSFNHPRHWTDSHRTELWIRIDK